MNSSQSSESGDRTYKLDFDTMSECGRYVKALGDACRGLFLIVTGGEKVYSLEVENAIASRPAVDQVGVIGVPDAKWSEAVHAVVVCDPQAVTAAALEAHAREWIAA